MASEADIKVYCYPADDAGCGHHRIIWVAEALRRKGHDVTVVSPEERKLLVNLTGDDEVVHVGHPDDADVMVFQRTTHKHLLGVLRYLRNHAGIATVIDVDDDLSAIDPRNPAWAALHPNGSNKALHSWQHLVTSCREATMVTVSTPALAPRYGAHGRVRVLPNYLAPHYYGHERQDSAVIGWPGAIHSHPDDPQVTRGQVARLVREGASFQVVGYPEGAGRAFGLEADPPGTGSVDLLDWPAAVAKLGIGIAPLADTRFNQAKSWLKPLELAAAGVPWVGSPRLEYHRLHRLHRLGCGLLADKPKDWYRHLKALAGSPAMRQELSEAGREVAAGLRLENHVEAEHWQAWEDALTIQRQTAPASVP